MFKPQISARYICLIVPCPNICPICKCKITKISLFLCKYMFSKCFDFLKLICSIQNANYCSTFAKFNLHKFVWLAIFEPQLFECLFLVRRKSWKSSRNWILKNFHFTGGKWTIVQDKSCPKFQFLRNFCQIFVKFLKVFRKNWHGVQRRRYRRHTRCSKTSHGMEKVSRRIRWWALSGSYNYVYNYELSNVKRSPNLTLTQLNYPYPSLTYN